MQRTQLNHLIPNGISLLLVSFTLSRLCGITNEIQFGLTNFFLIVAAVIIGEGISRKETFFVYFASTSNSFHARLCASLNVINRINYQAKIRTVCVCCVHTRLSFNFEWKTPLSNQFICEDAISRFSIICRTTHWHNLRSLFEIAFFTVELIQNAIFSTMCEK